MIEKFLKFFDGMNDNDFRTLVTELKTLRAKAEYLDIHGVGGNHKIKKGDVVTLKNDTAYLPLQSTSGWWPYRHVLKPGVPAIVDDIQWGSTGTPILLVRYVVSNSVKYVHKWENKNRCAKKSCKSCECLQDKTLITYRWLADHKQEHCFMFHLNEVQIYDQEFKPYTLTKDIATMLSTDFGRDSIWVDEPPKSEEDL